LLAREGIVGADNPFRPLVMVRAFIDAWEHCDLDQKATEDVVLSLEPAHGLDLAPLYEALNATLEKAGLSAERQARIMRNPEAANSASSKSPPSQRDDAADGRQPDALEVQAPHDLQATAPVPLDAVQPIRAAWSALAPVGRGVAAQARQFLKRLGLSSGAKAARAADAPDSEILTQPNFQDADAELMGYLGGLQAHARREPSHTNMLRQMRDSDALQSAPELDRGTVDALAQVFEFVFDDQTIPPEMKVLIGRLQIPVLKAAMVDRDFFLSDLHPARRLLDSLSGASVAWAPDKGENDPLYVRIEHTVQRILTEFEDDLTLFLELLREFTEFLFESEQQTQARVQPVIRQERDNELLDQARAEVDEFMVERLQAMPQDEPLLAFLLPFLTVQWREVMARALANEVNNPLGYELTLTTMEQLIWSTRIKADADQRRALVAVLPELVRQLNAGLDSINWTGVPRAEFTRRLISTHTVAIRASLGPASPIAQATADRENREGQNAVQQLDERRAAVRMPRSEDEADVQARAFERGMWFDFVVEQDTHVRCRLSWVSPMRTRLLFTNRDGYDAFVRSEQEVSNMLRLGRLTALEQTPIIARAIDKILVAQDTEMSI
jgi:hypothetical protein